MNLSSGERPHRAVHSKRAQRAMRGEHANATAFLYGIVQTADRLRAARDFDGLPALRLDARWTLLRAIEKCGGCPTYSDIARMLGVTRQSARALTLAAQAVGVVKVFPDPDDRRALQVALTPSGRRTLERERLPNFIWTFTLLNGLERKAMQSASHVLRVIEQRLDRYELELKKAAAGRRRHGRPARLSQPPPAFR